MKALLLLTLCSGFRQSIRPLRSVTTCGLNVIIPHKTIPKNLTRTQAEVLWKTEHEIFFCELATLRKEYRRKLGTTQSDAEKNVLYESLLILTKARIEAHELFIKDLLPYLKQ